MKFSDSHPFKRCFVFFLALILAIPTITVPIVAHAASFSDLSGHWATSYINTAVSKGIAGGYTDGTFRPDNSVTRAEFAAMINRAFGNTGSTSISFLDVPASEWYYNEVAKGMSAAFVGGYDDNTFRPDNPISRQEAAVMISRVIPTYGSSANLKTYSDNSSISDWATSAMSKICGKGYMGAYKDGKLHPLDNLTRAQTAKILCDIVASETMVSGTTTVRTNGTTLSNRIYTNDVVLHSDLGSGEASLSNCIVLGTLYVYGGGENTITVKNSRVANAVVEKSSSGVRLLAQGESVIANTSASKTSILETSGLSGNLYGTGFNLVNVKSSADTTLKGSFVKVNVVGSSAKMNLKSGTISTLDVESSGRNSDITVASGATVTTTNVNGAAAFHGSGTINTMNANTSGITYETKPRYVKTSNSSYDPNTSMNTGDNRISINPKNGATGVAVDDTITLTFDSATTRYNGTALTTSNIDDYIKLRRNSSSGTEVSYSASISSTKKVITISPSKNLEEDTKYYVTIDRNALMIGNTGNSSFSSYFTTDPKGNGSSTMDGITISPKKGATKVNVDSKITLTFDRAVTRYNGNALTNSNIEDYIELRKSKSSGTRIDFDASINGTKKTITITPKSTLTEDTKYYVTIEKNLLKFGGNGNSEFSSYFTTGDSTSGITFYPKNDATGISTKIKPTIAFSSAIETYSGKSITRSYLDSSVINFREGSSGGSRVSFSASINSSKKEITIEPDSALKDGQKYYLAIENKTLRTQSDEKNIPSTSVTWTVGSSNAYVYSFTASSTENTITATMTPNLDGTLYTVLLPSTYAAPSTSQVIYGTNASGSSVANNNRGSSYASANYARSFTYSGLAAGTNYTIYAVLKTNNTDSSVYSLVKSTTSTASPTISGFTASSTENTITATMTPNLAGTLYTVLLPNGSSKPSASQVIAGTNASGSIVASNNKGSSYVSANLPRSFTYSGLTSGTNYTVYAVLKTSSTNSSVYSLARSTTNTVNPTISGFTASSAETSVTATMTPNLTGTLYTVLLPSGDSQPSASQVIAGTDASGNGVSSAWKGSASVSAGSSKSFTYSSLAANTSYKIYAVLKTSNATSSVASLQKSTASPVTPEAKISSITVTPDAGSSASPSVSSSMNVTVPYHASTVTVTANSSAGDTIMINGNSSSQTVALSGSTTSITLRAIADGKLTKTYTLTINKELPDLTVRTVYVNGTPISGWSTSLLRTTANQSVSYLIKANDESHATVSPSSGSLDFSAADTSQEVSITVTNGSESKTYILRVTMDAYVAPPTDTPVTPEP